MAINLSFKRNEVDIYNWLQQFSSPTAIIKDMIRREMRKERENEARRRPADANR